VRSPCATAASRAAWKTSFEHDGDPRSGEPCMPITKMRRYVTPASFVVHADDDTHRPLPGTRDRQRAGQLSLPSSPSALVDVQRHRLRNAISPMFRGWATLFDIGRELLPDRPVEAYSWRMRSICFGRRRVSRHGHGRIRRQAWITVRSTLTSPTPEGTTRAQSPMTKRSMSSRLVRDPALAAPCRRCRTGGRLPLC